MGVLERRERCYYDSGYYVCTSTWSDWGRWVALVIIIIAAFLVFFLFACISARRRRRQGLSPMYGTGWVSAPPPAQYNQQPPPQYTPSGGYYSGQQNGVELQQPQNAYVGGQQVYQEPAGPPRKI